MQTEQIDTYTCPPLPTLEELFPLYPKILEYNYPALIDSKFDKLTYDVTAYPEIENDPNDPIVHFKKDTLLLDTSRFEEIPIESLKPGNHVIFFSLGPSESRPWPVNSETPESFSYNSMNPRVQRELTQPKKNCMIDRKKIDRSLTENDVPNVPIVPPYMYNPADECTGDTYFTFHQKPRLRCIRIDDVNTKRVYYFEVDDLQRRYKNSFNIANHNSRHSYNPINRFYRRLNDTIKADRLEKETNMTAARKVAESGIPNGQSTVPMHKVFATPGLPGQIRGFLSGQPPNVLPGQQPNGGTRRKRGRKGLKKRKTLRLKKKRSRRKNKK